MITKQFIAFSTILNKEIVRILRIWPQTLLPPAITMALYFTIFGHFVGRKVGLVDGVSYIQYIAPGLIMMSVINNAYSNVSSSYFGAKFQNNIDELLVAPVSISLIIWGYVTSGVLRGLIVGLLVMLVAAFFTHLDIQHFFIMLAVVILSALLFSLAGLINALWAKNFDNIMLIPTFILTPLTYLGGVFYSVKELPAIWQNLSLANPILYLVNAFRFGMIGRSDVSLTVAFSMIIVVIIVLYGITFWMMKKGKGLRS